VGLLLFLSKFIKHDVILFLRLTHGYKIHEFNKKVRSVSIQSVRCVDTCLVALIRIKDFVCSEMPSYLSQDQSNVDKDCE